MAARSPQQLATRRRIERGIAVAAPFLDLVLAVGDRVSRVAGRGDTDPEPPRRMSGGAPQTPIGAGSDRS
jgi:hypothetical protein